MIASVVAGTGTCISRMGSFGASSFDDLVGLAVARSGEGKLHGGFSQLVNFVTTSDDEREVMQLSKLLSYKSAAVSQLPTHTYYFDAGTFYFAALRDPLEFGNKSPTPWHHRTAVSFVPALLPR
jgi:hypothetical protein